MLHGMQADKLIALAGDPPTSITFLGQNPAHAPQEQQRSGPITVAKRSCQLVLSFLAGFFFFSLVGCSKDISFGL
jgi:hypothetical protein